jgi:hypothetical protein
MSLVAALLLGLVLPTVAGCVLLSGATGDESRPAADVVLARVLACGLGAWLLG